MVIQVKTKVIQPKSNMEQYPSHYCGKATSVANRTLARFIGKPKHRLYEKTSSTLTKLIYPPTIPVDIKITPNYREKPTL